MLYAVFNIANKGSAIEASSPFLRINGLNLTLQDAQARDSNQVETRVWPMSTESNMQWRTVSSKNLFGLSAEAATEALQSEYSAIGKRLDDWNVWRAQKSMEVMEASKNFFIRRPYHQLFAENLLQKAREQSSQTMDKVHGIVDVEAQTRIVPEFNRQEEIRGQTWALIAIAGDAHFESTREALLDELGATYFKSMAIKLGVSLQSTSDEHSLDMYKPVDINGRDPLLQDLVNKKVLDLNITDFFQEYIELAMVCQQKIDALIREPLIAFFGTSEDANDLVEMSEKLSKSPALLNADLAVVRMYSWIKLSSCSSNKIKHTSKDPRAESFFKSMRETLV